MHVIVSEFAVCIDLFENDEARCNELRLVCILQLPKSPAYALFVLRRAKLLPGVPILS